MSEVLNRIGQQRVLPVLRSADTDDAVATARACARGGLKVIELTRSTPRVEDALNALAEDDDLLLGVGTVTNPEQVRSAAAAGARFVVSFAAPDGLVETAHELGMIAIPGALTATEVLRATQRGADAVKLFPASAVEPGYLRDLAAVMPGVRILVTGGLRATPDSVQPWLDVGALAVGIGSDLGSVAVHGTDEVERRAALALNAASRASA